jgi:phosphoenolpyruvate carboxykinase (GTP)
MKFGEDGRLYAINPEAGFFGVAPGTSDESNPNAMKSITRNTIFTNVALTDDGDVWWEQMTRQKPAHLIDWKGNDWTPESATPSSHPNSRFTAPASQCPVIDPNWEDPKGVPIEAFLFGGRRASTVPLVYEANSWEHGTFIGSSIASEMTAAAVGGVGQVRHDPFAMLPFCGYHMGDYFGHWLHIGAKADAAKLPRIFAVNWFRKDASGKFLWPGYGENSRVLKWIFERLEGTAQGESTPIGTVPAPGELDLSGLDCDPRGVAELLAVDKKASKAEIAGIRDYYAGFGTHLPPALTAQLDKLERRLA